MLTPTTEDPLKVLSKVIAELITAFAANCIRGYLLGICAGWLFPSLVLGFWQWVLIAFTVRFTVIAIK